MIETEENKEQEEDLSCLHLLFFPISQKLITEKSNPLFLKLCARERVCVRTRVTLPLSLCCAALFRDSKQTLFTKKSKRKNNKDTFI